MYKASPTQTVNIPGFPLTTLFDYAGTTDVVYQGWAVPNRPTTTLTIATFTAANPGVLTVTAGHGLRNGNGIYISGATGDWAALNGNWYWAVVLNTTTFSLATLAGVAVSTTGYTGTFNGVVTTNAPLGNAPIWVIQKRYYDGSANLIVSAFARLEGVGWGHFIWDNRASYIYD